MSDNDLSELSEAIKSQVVRGASDLSKALGAAKRRRRAGVREVSISLSTLKKGKRNPAQKDAMFVVIMNSRKLRLLDISAASKRVQDELVHRLEGEVRTSTSSGMEPLSPAEEAILREGGLDPDAPLTGPDPVAQSQRDYERLRDTALSTQEAAALLGVNESRVRQQLTAKPPTLYGIKVGRAWRLPRFQFDKGAVIPGFARVLEKVPEDIHPLDFERWFETANPDLLFPEDAERELSPRQWLCLGYSPGEVAQLAEDL